MPVNIISNRLLLDWVHLAKSRGYDLKALLRASGIPWNCYESSRSFICGEQLARLSVEIRRLLDDQFMGYGRDRLCPALLDRILIKILAHAKDLKEVLSEWQNFYNQMQNTGSIITDVQRSELIYRFKVDGDQRPGTHVWMLDITMLKLRLFSWMIGKQIRLKAIGFAEPAPVCAGEYGALLSSSVFSDQPWNFFVIDSHYLHFPVIRTVEECLSYQSYLPQDFFIIPGDERRFTRQVEKAMIERLRMESNLPQIDSVAEELSISVRGLRRKLESEGESFQGLKDKVRRDLAIKKLACLDMSLRDIAADLGFSGTVAFSHAFKTWTGSAPLEFRRRIRAAGRTDFRPF